MIRRTISGIKRHGTCLLTLSFCSVKCTYGSELSVAYGGGDVTNAAEAMITNAVDAKLLNAVDKRTAA